MSGEDISNKYTINIINNSVVNFVSSIPNDMLIEDNSVAVAISLDEETSNIITKNGSAIITDNKANFQESNFINSKLIEKK